MRRDSSHLTPQGCFIVVSVFFLGHSPGAMALENILKAVGNTPIVRLNHVAKDLSAEVYVKLEFMNPGGSIKDRIGWWMIEDAEKRGVLKKGGTVVECTSGNTGVGVAIAARIKGYPCVFTLPDKMSKEKIRNLAAFGARVVVAPTHVAAEHPFSYYNVAKRIASEIPGSVCLDQYNNLSNRECHYKTTGPEIYSQMPDIDVFVGGLGTGGTVFGVGKFLKEKKSSVELIGVDVEGSIVQEVFHTGTYKTEPKSYKVEGIGEDFIPKNYDFKLLNDMTQVDDRESFIMARRLLLEEGLYCGGSSGSAVAGALKWARAQGSRLKGKKILVILPDSANRYLSKVFNDDWMRDNGFYKEGEAALGGTVEYVGGADPTHGERSGSLLRPIPRDKNGHGFATLAIHAGQEPDPTTGAVMTPIYQTSTFAQASPGEHKGYVYARGTNPTRNAYQKCLAALEGGKYGIAFSSGCAATSAVIQLLKSGDHILSCDDVYGGTFRVIDKVFKRQGIEASFADLSDSSKVGSLFKPNTKILWIESPTNPMLKVLDIAALAAEAKKRGIITVVDNTFASPYFQRPLDLGADLVVHSVTKYLNGHSDVVGGAVITNDSKLHDELKFIQNAVGAVPGPMDSFLVMRGLKTLAVRMERHAQSALAIAQMLEKHPKVEKVIYPGLESHPQHALAKKQMMGFGGMITFFIRGGLPEARSFLEKVKVFTLAESLGGVESLIEHPAIMTHASIPAEIRRQTGILDNLIRVSVGIEDLEDLKEDLKQALGG